MEMAIPWQLCRIIGPSLSQRLLMASAKAQSMGDFVLYSVLISMYILLLFRPRCVLHGNR